MMCEELRPEYGAYALGIAEDPERTEIAEHLARACPACRKGVAGASEVVFAMSKGVKPADPPKRLRRKVVAMVSRDSRNSWSVFAPWAVAGVLAVVLASVIVPGRLNPPLRQEKLEEALAILNDPLSKDVAFGDPAARGRVFVSAERGVVVMASHLPPIAANKTFELWLIPAQGNPIPAGTFRGNDDSSAVYVRSGPVNNATAVAVTVEPEGGSALPTTKPFIVTRL